MEGFEVLGAEGFEEWLLLRRESFHEMSAQALEGWAMSCLAEGRFAEGMESTERVLGWEPLRESAHRVQLRLLAASGQRLAALARHERFCKGLAKEMGLEPEAATRSLVEEIRLSPALSSLSPQLPRQGAHLPRLLTPMFGRTSELEALLGKLLDPAYPLLVVLGAGGMGKTRLALEAAWRAWERFAGGAWFISLAELPLASETILERREEFAGRALQVLEGRASGSLPSWERLKQFLKGRDSLLLLDNFDSGIELAPFLLELLREAPSCKLLVTSRFELGLQAAWNLPLEGLSTPSPEQALEAGGDFARLSRQYDSLGLFVERASRGGLQFRITAANWPAVLEICSRLDGLPLGVELAAALLVRMTCEELARRLRESYEILEAPWPDLPERHRSIEGLLRSAWSVLSSEEAAYLARLSVFAGGFTEAAVVAVAGDSSSRLRFLARRSLALREGERYSLHALTRQFALAQLAEAPEALLDAERRHAEYFSRWLEEHKRLLQTEPNEAYQRIAADMDNCLKAWDWALAHERLDLLSQAVHTLSTFDQVAGLYSKGLARLRLAVEKVRLLVGEAPASLLMERRVALGRLLLELSFYLERARSNSEAYAVAREAHGLGEATRDAFVTSGAALRLGSIFFSRSDCREAERWSRLGLELAREHGLSQLELLALQGLAVISCQQGDFAKAYEFHEQALSKVRALGLRRLESLFLNNLANTKAMQGELASALEMATRAERLSRSLEEPSGLGQALRCLGFVQKELGLLEDSRCAFLEALQIFRESGDHQFFTVCALHLCEVELERAQELGMVLCLAEEVLELSRQMGLHGLGLEGLVWRGWALWGMGDTREAERSWGEVALRGAEDFATSWPLMGARAGLALCLLERGGHVQARGLLEGPLGWLDRFATEWAPEKSWLVFWCAEALRRLGDSRAEELVRQAGRQLLEQSEALPLSMRRAFLHGPRSRRGILGKFELA